MAKRKRRTFTDEFKADAVKLCETGGRSIAQVAVDLDLTETYLSDWVKRAAADAGKGPPSVPTTRSSGSGTLATSPGRTRATTSVRPPRSP